MALSLQLGYPDVPKSLTNLDVDKADVLDSNYPMPFLTFIKIINLNQSRRKKVIKRTLQN